MLREENKSSEDGSELPNKASILSKPGDITFVTAIHEDGGRGTSPELAIEEVTLLEGRGRRGREEAKMVEALGKVMGFIVKHRGCSEKRGRERFGESGQPPWHTAAHSNTNTHH